MRITTANRSMLAPVLTLGVGLALAGCAGSSSMGTFDEGDAGLQESLMGETLAAISGVDTGEDIEYTARAPLVVPPDENALPSPQTENVAATNPNWPADARQRQATLRARDDVMLVYGPDGGVDPEATARVNDPANQRPNRRNDDDPSRLLTPEEMRQTGELMAGSRRATTDAEGRPVRRYLTDPPVSMRQPSPTADYGNAAEEAQEERTGWRRLWPF